jgi:hypothetical protein
MKSAKRLSGAKLPPKNPHQSPPIRLARSRLHSQTIWAAVLSRQFVFYDRRFRTPFVHALALGAAVEDLTQGDSGSSGSLGAARSPLQGSIAHHSAGNGLSLG